MDAPLQPAPLVNGSGRRGPRATSGKPRSLPIVEWPKSDRLGWEDACRPAQRLQRGGAASHLARVSQADIANRYGLYLDFLQRSGRLDLAMGALNSRHPRQRERIHRRTAGSGSLRHRVELGLQAAPCRAIDRTR